MEKVCFIFLTEYYGFGMGITKYTDITISSNGARMSVLIMTHKYVKGIVCAEEGIHKFICKESFDK